MIVHAREIVDARIGHMRLAFDSRDEAFSLRILPLRRVERTTVRLGLVCWDAPALGISAWRRALSAPQFLADSSRFHDNVAFLRSFSRSRSFRGLCAIDVRP